MFNVETQLTQKVRSEFIGRGKYKIVARGRERGRGAHRRSAVSHGEPSSFGSQQLASRYTLTMIARVQLGSVRDNKVLWENPAWYSARTTTCRAATRRARPGGVLRAGRERVRSHDHRFSRDHRQRDSRGVLVVIGRERTKPRSVTTHEDHARSHSKRSPEADHDRHARSDLLLQGEDEMEKAHWHTNSKSWSKPISGPSTSNGCTWATWPPATRSLRPWRQLSTPRERCR